MSRAVLTLEIPTDVWIGTVSRTFQDAQFRVQGVTTSATGGVLLLEVFTEEPEGVLKDIQTARTVSTHEVFEMDDEKVFVEIETETAIFLDFAHYAGVPIKTPFSVRDGEVIWELTASRDRLSALTDTLSEAGITFTVESIYQQIDSDQLLTDRQWTIVQTALENGYYDTPRSCTQEDLARSTGLAKSTCSEILHRAEERIIKRLVKDDIDTPPQKSKRKPSIV